jgi:hypothetical protein
MAFRRLSPYKKTERVPVGQVPSDYAGWATMAGEALGGKFGEAGAESLAEGAAYQHLSPWLLPGTSEMLAPGAVNLTTPSFLTGLEAAPGITSFTPGAIGSTGIGTGSPLGLSLAGGGMTGGVASGAASVGATEGLIGAGVLAGSETAAATAVPLGWATGTLPMDAAIAASVSPGPLAVAPVVAAGPPGWAIGLMAGGAALLGGWLGGLFEPEPETKYEDVFVEPVPIGGPPEVRRGSQLPSPMQFASMPEKSDTAAPPLSQYGIQNLPGFNT